MSNVYITEPNTTSKVVIHTSYGPLEIELWTKECPITTRNFITLSMERSFENTFFHRIVSNFIVQSGRVSDSNRLLYEKGIPKEFHSRLRFSRRGLLGAVSIDTKTSHPSEFFITLSATPELNNECTCFGRVVGDTVFNLLRIGEIMTTEGDDGEKSKPVWECKIERVEIMMNVFEDIIPRYFAGKVVESFKPTDLIKESRDKKLISFSIREDDGPNIIPRVTVPKIETKQANTVVTKRQNIKEDQLNEIEKAKEEKIALLKANIARLTAELSGQPVIMEESRKDMMERKMETKDNHSSSTLERMRQKYTEKKGVIIGKRQTDLEARDTVLKLTTFKHKLHRQRQQQANDNDNITETPEEEMTKGMTIDLCKLHGLQNCASCRSTFGLNDNPNDVIVNGDEWMLHKLVFDRAELDYAIKQDLGNLKVIDPKVEMDRLKRKAKQH